MTYKKNEYSETTNEDSRGQTVENQPFNLRQSELIPIEIMDSKQYCLLNSVMRDNISFLTQETNKFI